LKGRAALKPIDFIGLFGILRLRSEFVTFLNLRDLLAHKSFVFSTEFRVKTKKSQALRTGFEVAHCYNPSKMKFCLRKIDIVIEGSGLGALVTCHRYGGLAFNPNPSQEPLCCVVGSGVPHADYSVRLGTFLPLDDVELDVIALFQGLVPIQLN
jgi:hypothetical protein